MAARLCGDNPPLRTIGDDLESFVLLFLWIAGRYAPNSMSPYERTGFLKIFDQSDNNGKINLYRGAGDTAVGLYLAAIPFERLLVEVMNSFRWRYKPVARRPDVLEDPELKKKQELLESHKWLMDTISRALDDEEWKVIKDHSDTEQKLLVPAGKEADRKRKSQCPEYASLFANKRMKRGERGPRPVQDESEGEE